MDSASWRTTTAVPGEETNTRNVQKIIVEGEYVGGDMCNQKTDAVWGLFFFIDQVQALPCPGWGTVFSSSLPTPSGDKRSCSDSIYMALILQARDQNQSLGESKLVLHEYFTYLSDSSLTPVSDFLQVCRDFARTQAKTSLGWIFCRALFHLQEVMIVQYMWEYSGFKLLKNYRDISEKVGTGSLRILEINAPSFSFQEQCSEACGVLSLTEGKGLYCWRSM